MSFLIRLARFAFSEDERPVRRPSRLGPVTMIVAGLGGLIVTVINQV